MIILLFFFFPQGLDQLVQSLCLAVLLPPNLAEDPLVACIVFKKEAATKICEI